MLVRELMTSPATCLRAGSRLETAVQLLSAQHISALPVVDVNHHVVGIVSEADVLGEGIAVDPRSQITPPHDAEQPWHRLVDDVMTPGPVTVQENGDVGHVATVLADTGWKSLPVVRGQRLVGMISRSDILRVLGTPDVEIEREIRDEFEEIGRDAWHVSVAEGVVVVRGPRTPYQARLAKAVAETVTGVRRVVVVDFDGPP